MTFQKGQAIDFVALVGPITADRLHAYADASTDQNPIHLDEAVAKARGLPGVIAHGMLSMAFIGERALAAVEETGDGWRLKKLQSRFRAMVFLGDLISVGGAVKDLTEDRLILDISARNQKGEIVTAGTAEFVRDR